MTAFNLGNLKPAFQEKILPFFQEILEKYPENIHSLYLTGSALTDDFVENLSDINSIMVLRVMDLAFLQVVAPLGKKYQPQGLAAPLIIDLEFLSQSLDVFPIEFLNFQLIHQTLWGDDVFTGLEFSQADLKRQCERELKGKLMGLRRGYVSAMGDSRHLARLLVQHYTGYVPLLRAVVKLWGGAPPVGAQDVLASVTGLTALETKVFAEIHRIKQHLLQPGAAELSAIFADFYRATETLARLVNDLAPA